MKRLPAEWENQDCVLMVFPHAKSDWADNLLSAKSVFVKMASAICYKQKLILICDDIKSTKELFCYHDNISFVKLQTNDTWIRDFGPISIYDNNRRKLIDFQFNGWGGKFDFELDNIVSKQLFEQLLFEDFILEGGSIDSDGDGTILTTSRCLLNPNRNPNLTEKEIEEKLKTTLGAKKVLWLNNGFLLGDDTDSHIDTLARFVDKDTIVYVTCDEDDEHYSSLKKMEDELKSFKTIESNKYKLIPLPLPSAKYKESTRLPATYANFLIINHAILLPIYDDVLDSKMIELFKDLFPTREIIPINSLRLIEEGGSIHCSTMNIVSRETL